MKLKYPFEVMEMDDAFIAVPVADECDFHGVLRVNESARSMLDLLAEDTDEKTVISALMKEYDATEQELTESFTSFLDSLKSEGLIIE